MKNRHFRRIFDYAMVGGVGVAAAMAVAGCDSVVSEQDAKKQESNTQKSGAFVIIEEQSDGSYKVLEEYPSEQTRVMLKDKNGNERMLSQDEIDKFIKEEEKKIDAGQSELTNPQGGGLGIGGAILASAAGAILGSYIGNKLFGNQNFQANQGRNYKSPQAYERSKNSFNNARSGGAGGASNAGKKGFFGGNNAASSASKNSGFGG